MIPTISNYKEFLKANFKLTLDKYFDSLSENPIDILEFMKDASEDYLDLGFTFRYDLIVRPKSDNLADEKGSVNVLGGYYLVQSDRNPPSVMYDYYTDFDFLNLLKSDIEFVFRIEFISKSRPGIDPKDRAYASFAVPFLERLQKHYPNMIYPDRMLNVSDGIKRFRMGRPRHECVFKLWID